MAAPGGGTGRGRLEQAVAARPGEASVEEGVRRLAPLGEQLRSATSERQKVTRCAFILQAFLVTETQVITWPC